MNKRWSFSMSKIQSFLYCEGITSHAKWKFTKYKYLFSLYNDTTVLPKLCVKSQIWVEKDHCMQHIKLLLCKFWKNFLLIKDDINWHIKGSLVTQICILWFSAMYLELNGSCKMIMYFCIPFEGIYQCFALKFWIQLYNAISF